MLDPNFWQDKLNSQKIIKEKKLYEDSKIIIKWLKDKHSFFDKDIVIYGESLGTAVAGTLPVAAVGGLVGYLAVKAFGSDKKKKRNDALYH